MKNTKNRIHQCRGMLCQFLWKHPYIPAFAVLSVFYANIAIYKCTGYPEWVLIASSMISALYLMLATLKASEIHMRKMRQLRENRRQALADIDENVHKTWDALENVLAECMNACVSEAEKKEMLERVLKREEDTIDADRNNLLKYNKRNRFMI